MQPPAVDVGGESFVLTGKVFGRGGFGTVYEARSPKGETAAVKIVDVEGLSAEAQMRLDMESTSHERAGTHPNIVGFYGSIRQARRAFRCTAVWRPRRPTPHPGTRLSPLQTC